jgi:hypothetical protein
MRTTQLKISGEKREALLISGGPGFKIYAASGINGLILVVAKQIYIFKEGDADYRKVSRYVNLKYQPGDQQVTIMKEFELVIKSFTESHRKPPEREPTP